VRADRAGGRGHRALEQRAARQLSQEEKSARATFTVVNDGTPEELRHKLSAVLEILRA
jgi:dephospho-CoA kinase